MQTFADYASPKQFMEFSYQVFCSEFACSLLGLIYKDKYLEWVLFSDEGATAQLSGHVNRHNVQMWGIKYLHVACYHIYNGQK